jgi:peptidyl-prolyl cis-trans isomerase C
MFSNRPLAGYVLSVHPQKIDPPMTRLTLAAHATAVAIAVTLLLPLAASAQNIAIVNGKAVPKARLDLLLQQAQRAGQQVTPEMQGMAKDEVVRREMFAQEAEKRGIAGQADYKAQMELARQSILIRELFEDFKKKNPVTDAEAKAEYEKFKAQSTGTEFRASHILVESEEEAKALIAQIKGGAKFEDLAKAKSKDPGSGANGGDLDFAKPESYVPEFGSAMSKLKKGEMTETPVKSQFGWHIIRLDDTREAQFPDFESVKPQIQQRLAQAKLQKFQDDMRKAAKTDYKFAQ